MKRKHTARSIVSLLLCAYFLVSCAPSIPEAPIPQSTQALFETEAIPTTPKAEDIVYEKDSVPIVYLTTPNGIEVNSKSMDFDCNFKIELNGIFSEYENTYTDEDGGGATIHCRGNSSFST